MNEFYCCCQLDRFFTASAVGTNKRRPGEGQQRPHPLATGSDQMSTKFGNQRHLAIHASNDCAVHLTHLVGKHVNQRLERGLVPIGVGLGGGHRAMDFLNAGLVPVCACANWNYDLMSFVQFM